MTALRWMFRMGVGAVSFAYLIFVLNPIQVLSALVYPFSRKSFRAINRWCARSIWGWWVIQAEVQNGIPVRFVGDEPPPRENAILMSNHQSMADVLVLLCLAWRCGRLGDLKWFVKDVIKYFPGFGWGMRFLDCIFVKRDWAKDRTSVDRLFGKYKAESIPIFLVSFLEGTRRTDEKLRRARAYAEERKLYVPQHTLVPRTKGFVATLDGLRDHVDAVYDITIAYRGRIPTLVNCFEGRVDGIEVHVRRHAIGTLPTEEPEVVRWVLDRFEDKDRLLTTFAETQELPGKSVLGGVRPGDWFVAEARARQRSFE